MLVGVFIAILILIYVGFRLPAIIGKPALTITNLPDDLKTVQAATFAVTGKIEPKDQLTINNEIVYPDETGAFQKELRLEPGFNTFEFKVKKLLGQTTVIKKQIFYETLSL